MWDRAAPGEVPRQEVQGAGEVLRPGAVPPHDVAPARARLRRRDRGDVQLRGQKQRRPHLVGRVPGQCLNHSASILEFLNFDIDTR